MCLAGMFLAVGECGSRVPGLIMAIILLCVGGPLLYLSRIGKVKSMLFSGALVKGDKAKLLSTVFAGVMISLGAVILLSTIFGWGCPYK